MMSLKGIVGRKTKCETIKVGSRRSKLAITQTKWVIQKLSELNPSYSFEIKEIVTKGDQILDVTLSKVGGKGLFVKEIEQAMLNPTSIWPFTA